MYCVFKTNKIKLKNEIQSFLAFSRKIIIINANQP